MTSRAMVAGLGLDQGQAGQWGIDATAIQPKTFATESRLLYVQPNHALATDAGNTGEDPGTPFATVAAALLRCRAYRGDIVLVGGNDAWVYGGQSTWIAPVLETVTVSVPGVAIIGAHTSPLGTYWTAPSAGAACIVVNALDVIIQGFAFQADTSGSCITAEWDGVTLWGENIIIRSCYFDDVWDTAIALEFVWNSHIYNNVFQNCDVYGVYVDPAGSGVAFLDIHHNWFLDIGTSALLLNECDDSNIHHNTFFNATAAGGGAAPDAFIDTAAGAGRNSVHHNTMSCLLPGPGNGDYNDVNSAAATDSWVQNYLMNGPSVTNPT